MEESDRLRREMNDLLKGEEYKDLIPPKPLPPWPTLGHVLSAAGVYSGVAISFALLFVVGAVIYSYPVTVASFAAGILATVISVRLWRSMLRRGPPALLDHVWERFNRNHYARH